MIWSCEEAMIFSSNGEIDWVQSFQNLKIELGEALEALERVADAVNVDSRPRSNGEEGPVGEDDPNPPQDVQVVQDEHSEEQQGLQQHEQARQDQAQGQVQDGHVKVEVDVPQQQVIPPGVAAAPHEPHCEQFTSEFSGATVGCDKCDSGQCVMHDEVLKKASIFKSSVTNQNYYMRHKLNCKSRFVIYLVTCKRCHEQYVGKATQTLKRGKKEGIKSRHYGHRKEIKEKSSPLGEHFHLSGSCGDESFELQIIDCYETDEEKLDKELMQFKHTKGPQCSCKVCKILDDWEGQWIRELKPTINS